MLLRARDVLLPQDLKWAHEHAAEVVVDAASPHVPRRSGRLKRSLRASGTTKSGYARVGGVDGIEYGNAIHWGRKVGNVGRPPGNHKGPNPIEARPFLVDAADRTRGQITNQFEIAMRRLSDSIQT